MLRSEAVTGDFVRFPIRIGIYYNRSSQNDN